MNGIRFRSIRYTIPGIAFTGMLLLLPATGPADSEETNTPAEETQTDQPDHREYRSMPLDENGKPKALTMEETIRIVLDNNDEIALQQLEILKSDTDLLKDESQYSPILEGGVQQAKTVNKKYPKYADSGNITDTTYSYAKLKQLFKSGTYFELEGSDTRYDTNAGEVDLLDQLQGSGGDIFRPMRPLHTGALKVVLQQELLKNAFGFNQQRLNDINRNNARITRENMIYEMTGLVVQAMTNYWNLSIAEEQLGTSRLLLKNTRNILSITINKRNIGLAEGFEVNQWNALLARAQTSVDMARLDRDNQRRDLLRIMNLDPALALSGKTQLSQSMPQDIAPEQDLAYAYKTRPDFLSLRLQMQNTRKAYEIANNQLLPSVSIGGSYSSRSYGRHARTAYNEVPNGRFPDYGVEFKVEYPLWNESARVDARNARIDLQRMRITERKMHRQIRDEILSGSEQIKVAHLAVQNAQNALQQTQAYYNGLIYRYRQGRFTAVAVKEALDQLVQARQAYTEALVNFNISLIRYDFIRNKVFTKYDIDVYKVLDRLMKDTDEPS
ncbi:MAG: TolC family protein [Leptospiraceae bacterium]|nr:TolC family protein [Leptospiraceae bacterium]